MKFKPRQWSPNEVEQLKEVVKTRTWAEIAKRFGCSERTVRDKAKELGIRKYLLNKADSGLDLRIHEYSERHGIKQAAEHFKKTVDAVKNARRRVSDKRAMIRDGFTSKERFRKFRLACFKWAHKYGFRHEAEEFASIAMIQTLEGRNTTIQNLAKDYLSKKWKSYNGNAESNAVSLEASQDEAATLPDPELDLFTILDRLGVKGIERAAFLMRFKLGMELREIGRYFGLTESWASKAIKPVIEKFINGDKKVYQRNG